jgi:hypothetical protein
MSVTSLLMRRWIKDYRHEFDQSFFSQTIEFDDQQFLLFFPN